MSLSTALSRTTQSRIPQSRLLLLACSLAILGNSGCTVLHGLSALDVASSDPTQAAASPQAADVLQAFAEVKAALVSYPGSASQDSQDSSPEIEGHNAASERSVLKQRTVARRAAFTLAQIEAAPPPPALDRQSQPELLPIQPQAGQTPLPESGQQPQKGQPGTTQRIKSIREISLDIRPPQIFNDQREAMAPPLDEAQTALPLLAQAEPFTRGDLVEAGFDWQPAPGGLWFCYQPLYFQEVNVERYGRSFGMFQPVVSAISFYGRVPLLPYMVFARPARQCTDHAHWTLPGYRIPEWEKHEFVPSISGAAAESAALFGLILLIP
jgi:hypothetical protein